MKTYAIAAIAVVLSACAATVAAPPAPAAPAEVKELVRKDFKLGGGRSAEKEHAVLVHYTGWLYDPKAPEIQSFLSALATFKTIDLSLPEPAFKRAMELLNNWQQHQPSAWPP